MKHAQLEEILLALELELLLPQIRHSEARLMELLADGYLEFGSSGRTYYKKSLIWLLLRSESPENFQIDDFRLMTSSAEIYP